VRETTPLLTGSNVGPFQRLLTIRFKLIAGILRLQERGGFEGRRTAEQQEFPKILPCLRQGPNLSVLRQFVSVRCVRNRPFAAMKNAWRAVSEVKSADGEYRLSPHRGNMASALAYLGRDE
jgi:hypothetical protein